MVTFNKTIIIFSSILILTINSTASAQGFGGLLRDALKTDKATQPSSPLPIQKTVTPLDTLKNNDRKKSTFYGAAIGGGLGYLKGGKKGAVIGAIGGGVLGFIAGDIAAKKRQEYASEQEYLDAEIISAENAITTKESQLIDLEKQSISMTKDIDKLEEKFNKNKRIKNSAKKKMKKLNSLIEKNKDDAKTYSNAIEYLDKILKISQESANPIEDDKLKKEATLIALIEKRDNLSNQYEKLLNVNGKFMKDKIRLAALIERANNNVG